MFRFRFCWACGQDSVRYDLPRAWWWCVLCHLVAVKDEDLRHA